MTYCEYCLPEIPEGEHLVVRSDLKQQPETHQQVHLWRA